MATGIRTQGNDIERLAFYPLLVFSNFPNGFCGGFAAMTRLFESNRSVIFSQLRTFITRITRKTTYNFIQCRRKSSQTLPNLCPKSSVTKLVSKWGSLPYTYTRTSTLFKPNLDSFFFKNPQSSST